MNNLSESPAIAMVERQLAARGVDDDAILSAFRKVPREEFVPEDLREFAYDDAPLPIGEGQTISQPFIVACMIDAAEIASGHRVLEVGVPPADVGVAGRRARTPGALPTTRT